MAVGLTAVRRIILGPTKPIVAKLDKA